VYGGGGKLSVHSSEVVILAFAFKIRYQFALWVIVEMILGLNAIFTLQL